MPKPYPKEFKDDVVRVAQQRDHDVTIAEVAKDFGIHEGTLTKWMRQADLDSGNTERRKPGPTTDEKSQLAAANRKIRRLEQELEVMRRAAAYFGQSDSVKMKYPLVRDLAAAGIPVAVTCRVLKIARQPYYRWLANPISDTEWEEAHRLNALIDAHREDPEFGYRYLADEAEAAGYPMAHRTAWRLCRSQGVFSVISRRRKGKGTRPGPPVHDDLVARQFSAVKALNEVWLTDITEHHTGEGKLYLCAVKDACSRRIIGYSIDSRMKASLAVRALNNAIANRARTGAEVAGCIVHSDRGSQFRAKKFLRALEYHGLVGSMGRVGAAGDNAAMESFYSLLQNNVLDAQPWRTREELRTRIVSWIERTYHRRRKQKGLEKLTPVAYEEKLLTQALTLTA
ncbi:IS3 family transposase [Brevibacterium luteolum]|uniref:IS3 family transposase n=1 Tax=Brevibacterium luteolum TaxID=199591 RepID=UPI001EF7F283|nr:IS3 family transposase [Brevibacterium luteolum]